MVGVGKMSYLGYVGACDHVAWACFRRACGRLACGVGEDFDASWLGLSHKALSKTVSLVYASPVPEPSGYGLTLAGGAGLWAFIRRVRRPWAVGGRVTG